MFDLSLCSHSHNAFFHLDASEDVRVLEALTSFASQSHDMHTRRLSPVVKMLDFSFEMGMDVPVHLLPR